MTIWSEIECYALFPKSMTICSGFPNSLTQSPPFWVSYILPPQLCSVWPTASPALLRIFKELEATSSWRALVPGQWLKKRSPTTTVSLHLSLLVVWESNDFLLVIWFLSHTHKANLKNLNSFPRQASPLGFFLWCNMATQRFWEGHDMSPLFQPFTTPMLRPSLASPYLSLRRSLSPCRGRKHGSLSAVLEVASWVGWTHPAALCSCRSFGTCWSNLAHMLATPVGLKISNWKSPKRFGDIWRPSTQNKPCMWSFMLIFVCPARFCQSKAHRG